ncbi:uncharacterized protein LOC119672659 [Teleopsis dalmanni]|uniref:uncharacterized protein LOC119669201 n=1 Tax=Teleopsis dalmanni TaxID=139649 RepID=UPI0018CC7DE5|nr:uncharacterized protein LOC119669201 [Teleopsis dalmanni]XP_037939693.1 uncharacterized protein LOC119672657 [Teleopsis dalmanni]XP_037939695.1 uncharacterized protein LOC119672659 [Teleopsis dalmanni]
MVIAGANQTSSDHHRNVIATTTIPTSIATTGIATTAQQQQQNHNHANNNQNTIITTPSATLEHFNVTSLGELSNVQLSSITADGNLVTMGGVVVGRIHPATIQTNGHTIQQQIRTTAQPVTREELQQMGVVKVESPSEFISEG